MGKIIPFKTGGTMSEDKESQPKQMTVYGLILEISYLKRKIMEVYNGLPPEEKHHQKHFIPLAKGLDSLRLAFEMTFNIENKMNQMKAQMKQNMQTTINQNDAELQKMKETNKETN